MFGPPSKHDLTLDVSLNTGIIPRLCSELMSALDTREQIPGLKTTLGLSFVEVYNEELADLLNDHETIGAWTGVSAPAVLRGLFLLLYSYIYIYILKNLPFV